MSYHKESFSPDRQADVTGAKRVKVLVIEDDPFIGDALNLGLNQNGYDVTVATDGKTGLGIFEQQKPSIVILDLGLPDINGEDVCKNLRSKSEVPILVLTARYDLESKVEVLNLGADDYMVKPFAFVELLARMRTILRREGASQELHVLTFLDIELNVDTHEVYRNQNGERTAIELSPREFSLLQLFIENRRRVLSREAILDKVWGYDFTGENNIVEVYVGHLRKKIGEPFPLQTIYGVGYCLKIT